MTLFLRTVPVLLCAHFLPGQSCSLVADISPGIGTASPTELSCVHGDTLYFSASDQNTGLEPWGVRGSGIPGQLLDVAPGATSSSPSDFVACGSKVFFTATTIAAGRELYVTNGTAAGTSLVLDIFPGNASSDPRDIVCLGDRVLFSADDGSNGRELWVSNGTAGGTAMVVDLFAGSPSANPARLVPFGNTVLFSAGDAANGVELWSSDGTAAGTMLVKDINPGGRSSNPDHLTAHDGLIYFRAFSLTGIELWASDGTTPGTVLVKDINPGGDSHPHELTSCGSSLFFAATLPGNGFELWVHDTVGTRMVTEIRAGGASASPRDLVCCDGTLFFIANDGVIGDELYKSDGTSGGTVPVKDIRSGSFGSSGDYLTAVGRRVYLRANDGNAIGLWTSDGSSAGTVRLCNVTAPTDLIVCGCDLFFAAHEPAVARELFAVRAPGASAMTFDASCGPTLTSTVPVLGSTAILSGSNGPAGGVGAIVLDGQLRLPFALPGSGCRAWVLPTALIGAVVAPTWTANLPIPASPRLNGGCLALQVWWVTPGPGLNLSATNPLLLGLGM